MAGKTYQQRKDQVAGILRDQSTVGRDIGPLPKVVDPDRRESCRSDFRRFCEIYFAAVFNLAWSDDHLRVISIIEDAVLRGGLFAVAMPRGSGKTSLSICAAEWSLLYGHRSFVVLIGASEDAATDLLDHVATDFETNDLLNEDFPEVCHPIRALDGIVNRAAGQTLNGESTRIHWTAKELILPTVAGSQSSGAAVKVAGITGRIRGMSISRPSDGATIRPDFVQIDDPQTDESAHSPMQVTRRMNTINGAILGLAGPGKKIAGVMPITVIARDDVADRVLDRKKCPEWQGERISLMKSFPSNVKLWDQYAEIRAQGLREGNGLQPATEFYRANQVELDDGANAGWSARFNPDEASAIQHAMNLKLRDEGTFAAEYQNQPLSIEVQSPLLVTPDQVIAKVEPSLTRGIVPQFATKLTAFIDVQGSLLIYTVGAWGNDFTGHVLDYGFYPDQSRYDFRLHEVNPTLAQKKPGSPFEAQLYDGLSVLSKKLLGTDFRREAGGDPLRVSRVMIDANWGVSTATVKQFCRTNPAILLPSHGRGITADRKPLNDYQPRTGERTGWNWRIIQQPDRHAIYDTNAWKTFVAQRLLMSPGEPGNLSIFSADPDEAKNRALHKMFSEQVTAEYTSVMLHRDSGREVIEWSLRPNRENHFLDCLVGAAVAASEQGITATGHTPSGENKKPRRKLQVNF